MVFVILMITTMLSFVIIAAPFSSVDKAIAAGDKAVKEGDYATAAQCYTEVLNKAKQGVYEPSFCKALEYGGNANGCLNRYIEALDFYTHAIKVAEKYNNKKTIANCMNNIGLVYAVFSDYDRAVWYFRKAFDAALQLGDNYLLGISTTNLVRAYCHIGEAGKALVYLRLQRQHPLDNKEMQQFYLLYNQGMIAATQKRYSAALYYFRQAIETAEHHNLNPGMVTDVNSEMGSVYRSIGKPDSAFYYYKMVLQAGRNPEKEMQASKALAAISRENGDSAMAAQFQSRYIKLSDSIFDRQLFNSAREKLLLYENDKTERTIGNLQRWIYSLAYGIVLVVIILIIIFYYNKRLRSAQRLLVEKNQNLIRRNEEWKQLKARYTETIKGADSGNVSNGNTKSDTTGGPAVSINTDIAESADEADKITAVLGEDRVRAIMAKIEEALDNPEIISNPDFDLDILAKIAGTNTKYVSMVINGSYRKNFKSLLNEYRIREASRRLVDKQNYGNLTIAAIAQSVGYKSVNNFIIAFKKVNGMTPSQYLKFAAESASED